MFARPVALFLLILGASLAADTIISDEVRFGIKLKTAKLSAATPFTLVELERLSRLELSRAKAQRVAHSRFYGSQGGEPLPKIDHMSESGWREIYDLTSQLPNEIAELIAIDGNSVLRFRNASGQVDKRVLSGQDPLVQVIRGATYEVLYLAEQLGRYEGTVRLYFRTAAPIGVEAGTELLARMQSVFPRPLVVELYIRNDEWFRDESHYPYSNPFITNDPPPSEQDYGKTLYCKGICWPQ
ncbi:MAG: hypothetical protein ABI833_10195 [Acidobacteriota bacterium]